MSGKVSCGSSCRQSLLVMKPRFCVQGTGERRVEVFFFFSLSRKCTTISLPAVSPICL